MARTQAIQDATQYAIEVPLRVMKLSQQTLDVLEAMVNNGNPNSITDAGVGALCALTAVKGAFMNVKINAGSYSDKAYVENVIKEGNDILNKTIAKVNELEKIVNEKIAVS